MVQYYGTCIDSSDGNPTKIQKFHQGTSNPPVKEKEIEIEKKQVKPDVTLRGERDGI